jgi:hypothetical protein
MASPPREQRNEAQIQPSGRPPGSTGTSRARCCVSLEGTATRAGPSCRLRGRPPPRLTPAENQNIEISNAPDGALTLVAIDRNGWSRSIGTSGRDRRNAHAELVLLDRQRSSARSGQDDRRFVQHLYSPGIANGRLLKASTARPRPSPGRRSGTPEIQTKMVPHPNHAQKGTTWP